MGNSYAYPEGPNECEGISDCPRIENSSNGGLVFLYTVWALTTLVIALFLVYRHTKRNIPNSAPRSTSRTLSSSASSRVTELSALKNASKAGNSVDNSETLVSPLHRLSDSDVDPMSTPAEDILQIPYLADVFGTACYYMINVISVSWLLLFFILIIDFYNDCELEGIDSLCYYGSYPLFGNYDTNAEYFFAVWILSLIWYVFILVFNDQLRGWFMIPCSMEEATHMYVWSRDAVSQTNDLDDSYQVVRWVRMVQKYVTPERLREGHEAFVEVQRTSTGVPFFVHDAMRYLYSKSASTFLIPQNDVIGTTYSDFHSRAGGLPDKKVSDYLALFGVNKIPFERRSIGKISADEVFTYFYFYQFIMYIVWFWSSYLFVAAVEASVVVAGAVASIYIQYNNEKTLSVLTEYETKVTVKRNGILTRVSSHMLVPGDVVILKDTDWVLPSDMVLLEGSCVLNESGLTGESMPVQKTACVNEGVDYNPEGMGVRHTLFAGTTTLELNTDHGGDVIALVTSTGVRTSKGQLVASILFPEKVIFRYEEELSVVIFFLLIYGIVLFILSIYLQENNGSDSFWVTKWVYGIFTTSQIFSPLLPVALKVGQIRSSQRLLEKDIFCISPRHIAISGKVTVFCFDKTGTLTLDGMEFSGIVPVCKTAGGVELGQMIPHAHGQHDTNGIPADCITAMSTCHAVAKYGESKLVGNEVEVKMFTATNWTLGKDPTSGVDVVSSPKGDVSLSIIRKYEFDHSRQTMSVIHEQNGDPSTRIAICKGSFEKIAGLCSQDSIPANYHKVAKGYALNGGYVLGLARRKIDFAGSVENLARDDVETQESFELISLLIFRNEPKDDSRGAIDQLREGVVRPVMITGDNAQCGQYISRTCGLVNDNARILLAETDKKSGDIVWSYMGEDEEQVAYTTNQILDMIGTFVLEPAAGSAPIELAITGNATLDKLNEDDSLAKLLLGVRIFARMSPDNKTNIVRKFRSLGFITGMCGDGGNDCGALRAAHVGIALSEAEASVVSPFTSRSKSPQSVVDLLKEGRASLATSFANYKFLIMYGLLFSVVKLVSFWYGVIMSAMSYYCIDGIAITTLCYTMTLSHPVERLKRIRPTSSLLGPIAVASSLGVFVIAFFCLLTCLLIMANHEDYVQWPAEYAEPADWWTLSDNWEATVLYSVMFMFLIGAAGIYSFGYEFRVALHENTHLSVNMFILFFITSLIILMDPNKFTDLWHMASYQFNEKNSVSPVWNAYQADGNDTSPAMSSDFRIQMYFLICFFISMAAAWQAVVVEGFVGDSIRKKYPSAKRPPYRY